MRSLTWLSVCCLVVLVYALSTGIFSFGQNKEMLCSEPLTYRIGEIDDRFGVSEDEVSGLLQEVSGVWAEAAGTAVFEYQIDGEIVVNLVYEDEQRITDRERQFWDRLEDEELSIATLKNEYNSMNEQYEEEMRQYEQDSQHLQQSVKQLNDWVIQKNKEGGFNQHNLEVYDDRKEETDLFSQDLERREERLKRKAAELNEKVSSINQRIEDKNKMIEEYNRMFSGVRTFTQGAYQWDSGSKDINIFQFIDKEELKLVIAHEMGHALGIEHVSNPKSVMYRLMGEQARPGIKLTEEDVKALQNVCKNESI